MAFPETTGVVAIDDPGTSQGASQANTLDNLEANVAAEMDSQTGGSTGDGTPPATPVSGEPEAAPVSPAEGIAPAEADEAKMHRVSQDNSTLRAFVRKMGFDPDSDVVEQVNAGIVSYDDIVRARQPVSPTATPGAPTPPAPEISLDQKIYNLRSIVNSPIPERGYSSEDVQERDKAFMDVIAGQAKQMQNITQSQEQREQQEKANSMVNATNEVFNTAVVAELANELPEDVRQIGAEMFLGATDIANISLIKQHGQKKAVTAEGYRYSAEEVAPKMKQFIQSIYEAGRNSLNPNPAPNPPTVPTTPRTNVLPLRPGAGGGSPPPPVNKNKWDIRNLGANVAEHLSQQEGSV